MNSGETSGTDAHVLLKVVIGVTAILARGSPSRAGREPIGDGLQGPDACRKREDGRHEKRILHTKMAYLSMALRR